MYFLQKIINKNNDLMPIILKANSFSEIKKYLIDFFGSNWHRQLAKMRRDTKRDLDFLKSKIVNTFFEGKLMDEERFIFLIHNYKIKDNRIFNKFEWDTIKKKELETLKTKGYVFSDILNLSEIKDDNLYFNKPQDIIKYMFEQEEIKIIEITKNLVNNLNQIFNAKISNLRAFCSTLERQSFIRKVDTNIFVYRKSNEKIIAKIIYEDISKIKFNFINKDFLKIHFDWLIEKFNLIKDEIYYIFKHFYENKFYFSKGNSMLISINKEMSNLSFEKRILHYLKNEPKIFNVKEMLLTLGLNRYSVFNSKKISKVNEEYFLLIDRNNSFHLSFIKNKIDVLANIRKGLITRTPDIRTFLISQNEKFFKRLSYMYSFKALLNLIYQNKITYDEDYKYFIFK